METGKLPTDHETISLDLWCFVKDGNPLYTDSVLYRIASALERIISRRAYSIEELIITGLATTN